MAGYSQLKASMCLVAVNIMLFNYILSLCRALSWVLLEFMMTSSVRSSISLLFLPFPKY